MKSIKTLTQGRPTLVIEDDAPIPIIDNHPDSILVRTTHVGINHCDCLFSDLPMLFTPGLRIGSECAGEVIAVGSNVNNNNNTRKFRVGDRVASCTWPLGTAGGAFSSYLLLGAQTTINLGSAGGLGSAEGCGIGVSLATAFVGLYRHLGLPLPTGEEEEEEEEKMEKEKKGRTDNNNKSILIYGGATNTGLMALQLARISGRFDRIITTCSPKNFDLVSSLGATDAFDYHDADGCIAQIRGVAAAAGDGNHKGGAPLVLDCVGSDPAREICAASMAVGGSYAGTVPLFTPFPRTDVGAVGFIAGNSVLGDVYDFAPAGGRVGVDVETVEMWSTQFLPVAEKLFREGKLRVAAEVKLVPGGKGWEAIPDALQELRDWNLSAAKLVCKV